MCRLFGDGVRPAFARYIVYPCGLALRPEVHAFIDLVDQQREQFEQLSCLATKTKGSSNSGTGRPRR